MTRFSLVMATRGRTTEIAAFLDSLLAQGPAAARTFAISGPSPMITSSLSGMARNASATRSTRL